MGVSSTAPLCLDADPRLPHCATPHEIYFLPIFSGFDNIYSLIVIRRLSMPDMPSLTARDYDPWQLATPQQLLTLCQRLGVNGTEIARWLRVPPSSVSMWLHGTRAVPSKHIPALLERTRLAFDQAMELNDKAVALAPTEALRQTIRAEFAALSTRWKAEVLAEAGTLWRGLQRNAATLGMIVSKEQYTREDVETVKLLSDTMVQQMELHRTLKGETPSAEEALVARLAQAHEAAAPGTLSAEERAKAEADQPDRLNDD
jgi:DNA-binding transcriptional regulator YdaS (Cro superfamily)